MNPSTVRTFFNVVEKVVAENNLLAHLEKFSSLTKVAYN
jgi:hypothetical protein